MLKYLKEDWPNLLIYLCLGVVMLTIGFTVMTWQYWAILSLMMASNFWTRTSEFQKHFHDRMTMCDQCPFMLKCKIQIHNEYGIMPPFSAIAEPEDTSQHDAKPPSP